MEENLISLLTKLSSEILYKSKIPEKQHQSCIKNVRQKGLDFILSIRPEELTDPCRSVEGIVWNADLVTTDFCYELIRQGEKNSSRLLQSSVNELVESNVQSCDELLKFLLCLKNPFDKGLVDCKNPITFTGESYFLEQQNPYQLLPKELSSVKPALKLERLNALAECDVLLHKFIKKKNIGTHDLWNLKKSSNDEKNCDESSSPTISLSEKNESTRSISPWDVLLNEIKQGKEIVCEVYSKRAKFKKAYCDQLLMTKSNFRIRKRNSRLVSDKKNQSLSIYQQEQDLLSLLGSTVTVNPLKIITEDEYARHVQFILRGVYSTTFELCASSGKFVMSPGVCLPSVPPDTLQELSNVFLETGTCYLLLHEACSEALQRDVGLYGIVYHAFWKTVSQYLEWHSVTTSTFNIDCSLMLLRDKVKNLHCTITYLWKICDTELPIGGALLTYLFDMSFNACNKQTQRVLLSLIYDTTVVYLRKTVQPWIFQGCLDSLWNEDFFVYINSDMTLQQDRSYYLSIATDVVKVPLFLHSLTERIVACGKAAHLLKRFNPENKFTLYLDAMKYPKVSFCLNDADLKKLQLTFSSYEDAVLQLNDQLCPIKNYSPVVKTQHLEVKSWDQPHQCVQKKTTQDNERAVIIKRKREQRLNIDDEKEKERQRSNEIREAEMCHIIEEEKSRMIEKYNALIENAVVEKSRAEWRGRRLEKNDERVACLGTDDENDNNLLDHEGNIIDSNEENANVIVKENEIMRADDKIMNQLNAADHEKNNRRFHCVETPAEENMAASNTAKEDNGNIIALEYMAESPDDDNYKVSHQLTEAMQNKLHIMGGNILDPVLNADNRRLQNVVLTEGMKNKLNMFETKIGRIEICEKGDEVSQKPLTEALKNKLKILGTEYYEEETEHMLQTSKNITVAMKNKMKILGSEYGGTEIINDDLKTNRMTEAMKNKMKILGQEYTIQVEDSLTIPERKITEAMKNKMKILNSEYGCFNEQGDTSTSNETPILMTDAMRNKLKVLGSEIGEKLPTEISDIAIGNDNVILTDARKNKLKILDQSKPEQQHLSNDPRVLSDAMKNKLKILGSEYGLFDDTTTQAKLPGAPLTQAQKNKERMLSTVLNRFEIDKETNQRRNHEGRQESPNREEIEETNVQEMVMSSRQKLDAFLSPLCEHLDNYDPNSLFPSFPSIRKEGSRYDEHSEMDPEMLEKYLLKSMNIILSSQERLVNVALFKHYLQEENYISHVYSLRKYYLLYDGEFSRSLTQGLFELLGKSSDPKKVFARSSLRSIINEAVNYTNQFTGVSDTSLNFTSLGIQLQLNYELSNANNLSFQILEMPEKLNLTACNVLKPFQLSYKVAWPLNIILTEPAIVNYQKIFHLFVSLKRVHWTLNETFALLKAHSKDKAIDGKRLINSPHYTKLAIYRHAMTLYIMTLEEHMCANGPYEAWSQFLKDLECAKNLDDLYLVHVRYIKEILRRCFLGKASSDLLACIYDLIELGLKFHYTLKSSYWQLVDNLHYEHPSYDTLRKIFNTFCQTTAIILKTLKKKMRHPEMKTHLQLVELIEMKIIVQKE